MKSLHSRIQPDGGQEVGDAGQPVHQRPARFGPVRRVVASFRQARGFVAGLLIGMSVWTPVFVATAAEETEWQQYGLPGGLALLGAGIWLRMGESSRRRPQMQRRDPAGPSRPGMDRLAT